LFLTVGEKFVKGLFNAAVILSFAKPSLAIGYLQMTESEAVHTFQTNFPKYRRLLFAIEERGINIYKLSGELVGHLANALGTDKHLDKATDKLFPTD
jgi:hypothetical protein